MSKCSVGGCTSNRYTAGMCSMHYQRFRRHGDPHKVTKFSGSFSAEERFDLSYEVASNGCWNWTKMSDNGCYATLSVNGKTTRASRFSYRRFRGPIPSGLDVCHTCDNRRCVNPAHLWLGTDRDNQLDCVAKNRKPVGTQMPNHKLNESQVLEIYRSDASINSLAKNFGVSRPVIKAIKTGARWRSVTGLPHPSAVVDVF